MSFNVNNTIHVNIAVDPFDLPDDPINNPFSDDSSSSSQSPETIALLGIMKSIPSDEREYDVKFSDSSEPEFKKQRTEQEQTKDDHQQLQTPQDTSSTEKVATWRRLELAFIAEEYRLTRKQSKKLEELEELQTKLRRQSNQVATQVRHLRQFRDSTNGHNGSLSKKIIKWQKKKPDQDIINTLQERRTKAQTQLDAYQTELEQAERTLLQYDHRLETLKAPSVQTRQQQRNTQQEIAAVSNQLAIQQEKVKTLTAQRQNQEKEITNIANELQHYNNEATKIDTIIQDTKVLIQENTKKYQEQKANTKTLTDQRDATSAKLEDVNATINNLQAEIDALAERKKVELAALE